MNACDIRRASARARGAFTLVEMLVVIVIIGILAGMILYIIKVAGDQNAKAVTVTHIEKVRSAVEEFYAEYGQYPPVRDEVQLSGLNFRYEYPCTNGMSKGQYDIIRNTPITWGTGDNQGYVFTFGLMSFLVPRYGGRAELLYGPPDYSDLIGRGFVQWATNNASNADQLRDVNAMRRWSPMIADIQFSDHYAETINGHPASMITNLYVTVKDGWGAELHYRSPAPYQTYDIWSVGRDGRDGGPLAAITDPQAAKDDIHSSPGR